MKMNKFEILVAGVGGKGVLMLGSLIDQAARYDGFKTVLGSEIHGMAQRGGPLSSHSRMGEGIYGPVIPTGGADVIMSLEYLEGLRYIEKLSANGVFVMSKAKVPSSVMWSMDSVYPRQEEVISILRKFTDKIIIVDAEKIAKKLQNIRTANIVLLGASIKAIPDFPISKESFIKAIKENFPKHLVDLNINALERGMEYQAN